jgi:hypothetical protein
MRRSLGLVVLPAAMAVFASTAVASTARVAAAPATVTLTATSAASYDKKTLTAPRVARASSAPRSTARRRGGGQRQIGLSSVGLRAAQSE